MVTLILHLKQKCMKVHASTADIMAVRGEARQAVYSHIRKGMVVDYNLLEVMLANPLDRLTIVHWLEETDHVVTNKKSVQEIATQHATFITKKKTPAECTTVLNAARVKFLEVFRKANESLPISSEEQRWYLYYLEALFILKHMQRPAVVRNMTVEEWCRRKVEHGSHGRMSVIGIKENKTGAVATICLDEEEEAWMNTYYRHIRSVFLKNSDREIDEESERFFINSSGLPIINPSNDIRLFQKRINQVDEALNCNQTARPTDRYAPAAPGTPKEGPRTETHRGKCPARDIVDYLELGPSGRPARREEPKRDERAGPPMQVTFSNRLEVGLRHPEATECTWGTPEHQH
ncbi:hypothetical protein DPEC_G00365390 [Dallia pectoralis]|nr:hypothetical protein DPEC_G00365390 [Dallia pectoralis]